FNDMLSEIEKQRAELQTARDHLEERVKERTAELESFSYTVSHDLRAPLRAIDGFSRLLTEQYAGVLDAEGKRLLGVIVRNTQHMGKLIDALLGFTRLSRKGLQMELIRMEHLVVTVAEELKAMESPRLVAILVKTLEPAWGDTLLVRQVWVNLLSNAIKFTRKIAQPMIEVGAYSEGTTVVY